jgi:hypothetical protein
MNQNRNDGTGAIIMVVGGALALAAAFLFFLVALAAFAITLACIWARLENKPQDLGGGMVMTPQDAEEFLQRGVVGLFVVPAFLVFLEVVSGGNMRLNLREALLPAAAFGYVLFSMLPLLEGEGLTQAGKQIEILPPSQQHKPFQHHQMPPRAAEPPPFRYASWDDEDIRDNDRKA